MKDLINFVKDWFVIKTAKNPEPDLEMQVIEAKEKFHEKVNLLRLSSIELVKESRNMRFEVLDELIKDIARSKR